MSHKLVACLGAAQSDSCQSVSLDLLLLYETTLGFRFHPSNINTTGQ